MAANSHTTPEYAATNTVPKSTAPMSHDTTNTTGPGSSRNLAYALTMRPADVRARARCSAPEAPVRRCWLLLTPRRIEKTLHLLCLEVAGCATGSARLLLSAHTWGGLLCLYSGCCVPNIASTRY